MSRPAPIPALPLLAMQWAQRLHDTYFHPDIAVKMTKAEQLRHIHSHMSKYGGTLAGYRRLSGSDTQLRRLTTDVFIMALSGANTLPLDLARWMQDHSKSLSTPARFTPASLTRHMAILNGKMGKALEAHDHIENFPVRPTLENALGQYCHTAMTLSAQLGHDLTADTRARWQGIEQRDPFVGYILTHSALTNRP